MWLLLAMLLSDLPTLDWAVERVALDHVTGKETGKETFFAAGPTCGVQMPSVFYISAKPLRPTGLNPPVASFALQSLVALVRLR